MTCNIYNSSGMSQLYTVVCFIFALNLRSYHRTHFIFNRKSELFCYYNFKIMFQIIKEMHFKFKFKEPMYVSQSDKLLKIDFY